MLRYSSIQGASSYQVPIEHTWVESGICRFSCQRTLMPHRDLKSGPCDSQSNNKSTRPWQHISIYQIQVCVKNIGEKLLCDHPIATPTGMIMKLSGNKKLSVQWFFLYQWNGHFHCSTSNDCHFAEDFQISYFSQIVQVKVFSKCQQYIWISGQTKVKESCKNQSHDYDLCF